MNRVNLFGLLLAITVGLFMLQGVYGDSVESNCFCPRIYDPVCGTDTRTYSNKCMFDCQQKSAKGRAMKLKIAYKGTCGEPDNDDY